VEAEPLFGVLDLSVTFSKEGSFASCAAKQVTNPALPHETELGRAAKLTLFVHAQPHSLPFREVGRAAEAEQAKPDCAPC
jgi:hypothetical protein